LKNTLSEMTSLLLGQKPQIVVFNKMDLPEAQERFEDIKTALKERGVEITAISAVTRQNIEPLVQRIFLEMSEMPEEAVELTNEAPLYQLTDNEPVFTIERDDDGAFVVKGKRIERAASMTYWDYPEAVQRFQKILEVLGITSALKKQGVQVGDTVFIGEHELEWGE